jgi:hypothetical protein
MKIYITKEGKEELEAKIEEIEKERFYGSELNLDYRIGQQKVYKEFLSQCIVLPNYYDWNDLKGTAISKTTLFRDFSSGVIIEPKQ